MATRRSEGRATAPGRAADVRPTGYAAVGSGIETKPFWMTSEFLVMVGMVAAVAINTAVADNLDLDLAWMLIVALGAIYMLSRGIAKAGSRSRAFDPREEFDPTVADDLNVAGRRERDDI